MSTTPEKVKAIAKHLAGMSNEDVQMYIDDAAIELPDYNIKKPQYEERLIRYFAAHLATLNVRRKTSEKVSDMSKTYEAQSAKEKGLCSTEYGQEFERLLKRAQGPNLPLTVV